MSQDSHSTNPKFSPSIEAYLKNVWEQHRASHLERSKPFSGSVPIYGITFFGDDGIRLVAEITSESRQSIENFIEGEFKPMFGENGPVTLIVRGWKPV